MFHHAKRIVVTGNTGAGKTTLSNILGTHLGLTVHHLDEIIWQPGWQRLSQAETVARLTPLLAGEQWIIDGVSSQCFDAADTIVFLDFSPYCCAMRATKRILSDRYQPPSGCGRIGALLLVLKLMWIFPRHTRPVILRYRDDETSDKQFIWIRDFTDQDNLLGLLDRINEKPGESEISLDDLVVHKN